ncbi:hypothetical protein TGAM01_v206967 [Trichoderma gamsii]|uniref:Uncharacterized protein n=1 Tax=Trichoderma gamsii TaxID=398673 RepID=A0A2P4ZJ14_9HYPO|nr:hypothetical protein TGAM01_v206967 [Trichoderma gamsii]PON24278.1 hypothetical protein TGAM01_v206967 [Trichoderma gamsii]
MDAGSLAQMSSNFVSPGGLASRRGSQNIKPLSFDTIKQGNKNQDGGIPTPRTSRSHLLAGLRTAPKSAAAASFGPMSPTGADGPMQQFARNGYGYGQGNVYNPPLTAFPQYGQQHQQQQQQQQQQHHYANQVGQHVLAAAAAAAGDAGKSPAPKTATFPTPATGGYGPGQARAGEHPIRQPRGPPSMDELKAKPTAKYEGSKNFATRTRRSAVHNLVRAGLERRKGSGSSSGSMSPVSETAEESATPITDNESDSGRSGSGSLAGEVECRTSRASAAGGWGAIGSDRPSSRQKVRGSVDSNSGSESDSNSFADVFKNGALRASKSQEAADGQRKAPRLVLTSVEKRKMASVA